MKKINFGIGALAIAAMLALDGRYLYEGHHALESVNAQSYLYDFYTYVNGYLIHDRKGYVVRCWERKKDFSGSTTVSTGISGGPSAGIGPTGPQISSGYNLGMNISSTVNWKLQYHYDGSFGGYSSKPTEEEKKWQDGYCFRGNGSIVRS